jgi:hypothetical protein
MRYLVLVCVVAAWTFHVAYGSPHLARSFNHDGDVSTQPVPTFGVKGPTDRATGR